MKDYKKGYDPEFEKMEDKGFAELVEFLQEQQVRLLAIIDEGPEDNSIEAIFPNPCSE